MGAVGGGCYSTVGSSSYLGSLELLLSYVNSQEAPMNSAVRTVIASNCRNFAAAIFISSPSSATANSNSNKSRLVSTTPYLRKLLSIGCSRVFEIECLGRVPRVS